MKAYMASTDWSENVPSTFSSGFPLAKTFCKKNWKWLNTGYCFDTNKIQWPCKEKGTRVFWKDIWKLIHMSGVMNNEVNKEKKWISCKLTSTKCKKSVAFAQDWSHTLFQTSSNNHALVDIDEKQIICYFIQLGRVLRQLLTLLRQYIVGPTLPPLFKGRGRGWG